jgi:Secretion system C-terminal sorting domain
MKKTFLTLLFFTVLFQRNSIAQITLEHTYPLASVHLYMTKLEVDGDKYVWRDLWINREIKLYNLNHSLFKTMTLPGSISWVNNTIPSLLYISQHLFALDDSVEYMFVYIDVNTNMYKTTIINELGSIIFVADSLVPLVMANVPQEQVPIYNTSAGTKMILSVQYGGGIANVYGLPGNLTTSIEPNIFSDDLGKMLAYPNPTSGESHIPYQLPLGETTGEIVFYNLTGAEIKRYRVDTAFTELVLTTSDLAAGSYYYQLQTPRSKSEGKKLVVIK